MALNKLINIARFSNFTDFPLILNDRLTRRRRLRKRRQRKKDQPPNQQLRLQPKHQHQPQLQHQNHREDQLAVLAQDEPRKPHPQFSSCSHKSKLLNSVSVFFYLLKTRIKNLIKNTLSFNQQRKPSHLWTMIKMVSLAKLIFVQLLMP